MNDLAAYVNGCAKGFEGDFDDVDGTHHTSAEAARLEQQDSLLGGGRCGAVTVRNGFEDSRGHINSISTVKAKDRIERLEEPRLELVRGYGANRF